jgi:hypothetical protein
MWLKLLIIINLKDLKAAYRAIYILKAIIKKIKDTIAHPNIYYTL